MSFLAGIGLSELPKASSSEFNKVVFCLHGTRKCAQQKHLHNFWTSGTSWQCNWLPEKGFLCAFTSWASFVYMDRCIMMKTGRFFRHCSNFMLVTLLTRMQVLHLMSLPASLCKCAGLNSFVTELDCQCHNRTSSLTALVSWGKLWILSWVEEKERL